MTFTIESQLMAKSLTVIRQIVSDFVFLFAFPKAALLIKKVNKKSHHIGDFK